MKVEKLKKFGLILGACAITFVLYPNTGTNEFALRDSDGYYVMVSALAAR